METHYSPLPLVVVGSPQPAHASIRADLLPGQRDWVELFTAGSEAVVDGIATATIMVDEMEFEVAVDSLKIFAFAAKLSLRRYLSRSAALTVPTEPHSTRLAVDFQPEPGHAYEYSDKFTYRYELEDGFYAGQAEPEDVERWTFSSGGFWLGAGSENELAAVLVRLPPEDMDLLPRRRRGLFGRFTERS